jgi:hypothetical protein
MNKYFMMYLSQLIIIGVVINIRVDIPFWKQMIGYLLVALILPASEWMSDRTRVRKH